MRISTERERESVCVSACVRERECVSECVCVHACVCERERESVCVFVCVWQWLVSAPSLVSHDSGCSQSVVVRPGSIVT